jgi:hypothetical protein
VQHQRDRKSREGAEVEPDPHQFHATHLASEKAWRTAATSMVAESPEQRLVEAAEALGLVVDRCVRAVARTVTSVAGLLEVD